MTKEGEQVINAVVVVDDGMRFPPPLFLMVAMPFQRAFVLGGAKHHFASLLEP